MEDVKYKIGELASIAKVSTKAIRIYEEKGLIESYRDENNNYRYFTEEAVVTMQRIQMFKYLGFGLDAIKQMMDQYEHMNLTESFLEQKRMLEKKKLELERMIYCMDRAANESQKEDFKIGNLFDSLNTIIISRMADEVVIKLLGHSDEPRGWSRWIFDQANLQPGENVLDAGCGWGNLWRYNEDKIYCNMDVTLVDFHNTHADGLAEYIQDKPQFHFIWGDLNEIDFPEKYHCIFFNHVVFYMKNKVATYKRLKSYLTDDGRLFATWGGILVLEQIADLLCEYVPAEEKKIQAIIEERKLQYQDRENELREVFTSVEKKVRVIKLYFSDAKEMTDYIETSSEKLGVNISDNLMHFEAFLEEKYKGKEFNIEKDAYLFECR